MDIAGKAINRYTPSTDEHRQWPMPTDVSCIAPRPDGGLIAGMRDGIFHVDVRTGKRERIIRAPYDPKKPALQRRQGRPAGPLLARHHRRGAASRTPRCGA